MGVFSTRWEAAAAVRKGEPSWTTGAGLAPPENPTPVEAMAYRLRTLQGRALCAPRKQTPEPVFGIIKSVMGPAAKARRIRASPPLGTLRE
jgi:hypothetical protein